MVYGTVYIFGLVNISCLCFHYFHNCLVLHGLLRCKEKNWDKGYVSNIHVNFDFNFFETYEFDSKLFSKVLEFLLIHDNMESFVSVQEIKTMDMYSKMY